MARKTLKSAKARALLRAERARSQVRAQQTGSPSQGNLWSNPDVTPKSSKSGPGGAPLYNADQKDMVSDPKVKKTKGAEPAPRAKRQTGGPSTSPLYDANQTDLTDVGALDGKPQDKLKGASRRGGVIAKIRRKALAAAGR